LRRLLRHRKGQFVIIAVLMIAVMIVSIGAVMNRAVTYYKQEPWEEYLTLIGSIELGSRRLVELSLANYTNAASPDSTILRNNLQKWQINLTKIYPGYGVIMNYTLANQVYNVYGTSLRYSLGLNQTWLRPSSFSAANSTFNLDINSVGLKGYKFTSVAFLNLIILNVTTSSNEIAVAVKGDGGIPVTGLGEDNFQVVGFSISKVTSSYDQQYLIVYKIKYVGTLTLPVTVKVWDTRGIQVTAKYP